MSEQKRRYLQRSIVIRGNGQVYPEDYRTFRRWCKSHNLLWSLVLIEIQSHLFRCDSENILVDWDEVQI